LDRRHAGIVARVSFDKLRMTLLMHWRETKIGVTLSLSKGDATQ